MTMATATRDDRGLWKKAMITVPLIVGIGFVMGAVSNSGFDNGWYANLSKPGFQPPPSAFGVNEKDQAWVKSKLTDQPNGVATQPIKLTGAREKIAKKTYIRAPKYPQAAFDKALADCKADASWKTFVNENTGHDVMVDQPQWLADIILQVS